MAKTKVSEWSTTPSSNTDIDGINISEGCAPSGINDAIRDMMAQIRSWQSGTYGDTFNGPVNGTVGATTPSTGAFTTLSASSTVTLSGGTANGVAYLNGSKVVTSGSALTFDGTNFGVGVAPTSAAGTTELAVGSASTNPKISGIRDGSNAFMVTSDSVGSYFYERRNLPLLFGVNNSEQMRLTSTGLGIGTSSPARKLDVSGASPVRINTTADNQILLAVSGTAYGQIFSNSSTVFGVMDGGATGVVLNLTQTGNLGLGVTPSAWNSAFKVFEVGAKGNAVFTHTSNYNVNLSSNAYYDSVGYKYGNTAPASYYNQYNGIHSWYTAPSGTAGNAISFTQAMTLTASGELLVGTTGAQMGGRIEAYSDIYNGVAGLAISTSNDTTGGIYAQFGNSSGTKIGSITRAGSSSVAYNTSSDYRLKENIQPMTGALAKVALLKPVTYKWNADGSDGEGFIAHELAEVVPQCVTGEKDAVDEEGNPKYQGIDTSFLAGLYAAALQELIAEVNTLKSEIAVLKAK